MRGLRWSKVKICVTTTIYTHTGGLIRLYIVIWSVLSQFKWLLLFLHHAWRGHGARLSIRPKDPNNHSDTETGTLSKSSVLGTSSTLVEMKMSSSFKARFSFAHCRTLSTPTSVCNSSANLSWAPISQYFKNHLKRHDSGH